MQVLLMKVLLMQVVLIVAETFTQVGKIDAAIC
jgi:hypothetical protein